MEGYIYLHRKLQKNPIYGNSIALHCWIECLFRATYEDKSVYVKRQKIELNRGQFLMGYREFAETIRCSKTTIHYWFNIFEVERFIVRKTMYKGTIVTINNYDQYQTPERFIVQRRDKDGTKKEPTNKGNKGNKSNKGERKSPSKLLKISVNKMKEIAKQYNTTLTFVQEKRDSLYEYCLAHGKKYNNYVMLLKSAVRKDVPKKTLNLNKPKPKVNYKLITKPDGSQVYQEQEVK